MHDSHPAVAPPAEDTRGIIPILLMSAFVLILNETTMGLAIPRLMIAFEIDATAAQWVTTAFLLTMATVIPLSGFILQRLRTRQVYVLSMGLFSLGTLVCGIAPVFGVLLLGRVIQASGTAMMMPLLMTTILTLVPVERRGRMMGNVSIVISVAPALGPTVSGLILQFGTWRLIFALVLPIALAMGTAGFLRLKNFGATTRAPVDVGSVVLSALGFGGLVYALTQIGEGAGGGNVLLLIAPLLIGLTGLGGFVWRQVVLQREDRPLLDLRTFTNRTFALAVGIMMVCFGALLGGAVLFPIYLQELRGLSPVETGLILLPGGLVMGLMGPVVGRLYDRVGPRVLVVPGVLLLSALLFTISRLASLDTPVWLLVALWAGISVALGLTFTPTMTAGLNSLRPKQYSHGSALVGTLQQVAGGAGTALLVTVMSLRWAGLETTGVPEVPAHMGGVQLAFAVGAALVVLAVVLAAMMPGRAPRAVTAADAAYEPYPAEPSEDGVDEPARTEQTAGAHSDLR